jgi:CDP-paratose 2-epimerase
MEKQNNFAPVQIALREKLGLCQWFHYQASRDLQRVIDLLAELGVKHLRTGISWADYHRTGGPAWYDAQMHALRDAGLTVLLSVWHTPPSLSEGGQCASPPRRLQDFADFIDLVITQYGDCFETLELWNEPNNRIKWNFREYDPQWAKFGEMIAMAGNWARQRGKPTVLGGMIPVDTAWLALMEKYGALQQVDAVAIHGFPGMWWPEHPNWDWHQHWLGWEDKVERVAGASHGKSIWITETGLATYDLAYGCPAKHELQVEMLDAAAAAPAERVYWYSALDLDPHRDAIEGFHVDENEYHLGLVTYAGEKKPAFYRFQQLMKMPAQEPLLLQAQ